MIAEIQYNDIISVGDDELSTQNTVNHQASMIFLQCWQTCELHYSRLSFYFQTEHKTYW